MGMYTHLVLDVNLKENTPKEIIDTVNYMVGNTDVKPTEQNHELFDTDRWDYCLRCESWYFMGKAYSIFDCSLGLGVWRLTVDTKCKNYCNEYEKFLDYIQPYISYCEYLGFIRYEEYEHPTLVYNTTKGIEYVKPEVCLNGELY